MNERDKENIMKASHAAGFFKDDLATVMSKTDNELLSDVIEEIMDDFMYLSRRLDHLTQLAEEDNEVSVSFRIPFAVEKDPNEELWYIASATPKMPKFFMDKNGNISNAIKTKSLWVSEKDARAFLEDWILLNV